MRAVSAAVGVSNGALYHTFESRAGLLGRTWIRAARRFFTLQHALVDRALTDGDPPGAVVAAAEAPAVFAEQHPDSSAVLWAVSREELLATDLPDDVAAELQDLHRLLIGLMIRLADTLWQRTDARAVDAITTCIVDLPTSIVLSRDRLGDPTAHEYLRASVRAVLDVGPPPPIKERNDNQSHP
jgi:AcrR family transcriptional regulator